MNEQQIIEYFANIAATVDRDKPKPGTRLARIVHPDIPACQDDMNLPVIAWEERWGKPSDFQIGAPAELVRAIAGHRLDFGSTTWVVFATMTPAPELSTSHPALGGRYE